MSTSRLAIAVSMCAALAGPGQLPAHQGHDQRVMGTVTSVDGSHVEVETKDGKKASIILDGKTKYLREKTEVSATEIKVGQRVVVSVIEGKDGKTIAREVSLAPEVSSSASPEAAAGSGSEAATRYTCPMHPEVMQDKPGKCPKCKMTLEPKR